MSFKNWCRRHYTQSQCRPPAAFSQLKQDDDEPSLPLGIDTDADYPDRNVVLNDDDRLTLYTDGVLEACNSEGELYGFERVASLLADRPDAKSIAKTARSFGQEDDITVLTITRLPTHDAYEAATASLATS